MSDEVKLRLHFGNSSWFIEKLTYGGSAEDCLINYILIALCLLVTFIPFTKFNVVWWKHMLFFVYLWIFQIMLWQIPQAQGVSIIWCGQIGWLKVLANKKNYMLIVVNLVALCAICYYFYIMPVITTVAHVMGVLMGYGM